MGVAAVDVGAGCLTRAEALQPVLHRVDAWGRLPFHAAVRFALQEGGLVHAEGGVRVAGLDGLDGAAAAVPVGDASAQVHRAVGPIQHCPAAVLAIAQAHVVGDHAAAGVLEEALAGVRVRASVGPRVDAAPGDGRLGYLIEGPVHEVDLVTHPLAEAARGVRPEKPELAVLPCIEGLVWRVGEELLPEGVLLGEGVL